MTFHVALNRLWHATTVLIHQKPNPGNPVNRVNPARICKICKIIEAGRTTVPGSRMRLRSVGQERQLLIRSGEGKASPRRVGRGPVPRQACRLEQDMSKT